MSLLASAHRSLRRRIALHAPNTPDSAAPARDGERGDVPGWVLVTLMTAGLVTLLWQTAGPLLQQMFTTAMSKVSGG